MKRLLSLTLFLLILGFHPVSAETIVVSGDVWGTWSADTVLVTGEVRVPPGQVLYIEPGVEVLFQVYCKLIVDNGAALIAVGTETEPIRFDEYSHSIHWHGIQFLSSADSSRLEYCILKHGRASGFVDDGGGIYCEYSNPTIANCRISNCSADDDGGAIFCSTANPNIIGNVITNNFTYDQGGGIFCYYSSPLISENVIENNHANDDGGAIYLSHSNAIVTNNYIRFNTANGDAGGISCYYSDAEIIGNHAISDNSAWGCGGGIYCYSFNSVISDNTINGNYSYNAGGGIEIGGTSNAIITGNIIADNSAFSSYFGKGGGICNFSQNSIISDNLICGNYSDSNGGGIYCVGESSIIVSNTICCNITSGGHYGGGVYLSSQYHLFVGNKLVGNIAKRGGGIYLDCVTSSQIAGNSITSNTARTYGGGIYFDSYSEIVGKNTVIGNNAVTGGGICTLFADLTLVNCIIRGNTPQQIVLYSSPDAQVRYSNIEGGWPGEGNIDADPMFVNLAQNDCRLLWGSPCIDAGDPDPVFFDPDTTRADMGAFYYDQSTPIRILLTPENFPIQVPGGGGDFNYWITLSSISGSPLLTNIWCDVTLPGGSVYGPVLGPVSVSAPPESNVSRYRTQFVPAGAPQGLYTLNIYAVMETDTSSDSFVFEKLASDGGDRLSGWFNTGESFDCQEFGGESTPVLQDEFVVLGAYPNPFNPVTAISYQLPAVSHVNLAVYDVSGRIVVELVNGWREAGYHEVTFDASALSSGIFIYRLKAGAYAADGKMILMK